MPSVYPCYASAADGPICATKPTKPLRDNIFKKYGADHATVFDESLRSLLLRLAQTEFHIGEVRSHQTAVTDGRNAKEILKDLFLIQKGDIGSRSIAVSAHAIAAIQALHSVSDILGATIMFSMKQDTTWTDYLNNIPQKIKRRIPEIKRQIDNLRNNEDYRYLVAVANHSKHTSVVPTGFNFNFNGTRLHGYDFFSFEKYDKSSKRRKQYASRGVLDFLEKEYNRQIAIIQKILIRLTQQTKP